MMTLCSEDAVVYVTTEDGKRYRLEAVLNRRAHLRRVDEIREEQTRRREWYRRHVVSRDMPNSKAARIDYSDSQRWEHLLFAWLDGALGQIEPMKPELPCVVAKRNCKRIARRLMLADWRNVGYFVASVWKYGSKGRATTISDFGISEATYYRRLERYAQILGFRTGVDKC